MADVSRRQVLGIAGSAALAAAVARVPTAAAAGPEDGAAGAAGATRPGLFVPAPDPVPVALDAWFDNDGIDTASAHGGNFDGSGYTFPGEQLPSGRTTVDGVPYLMGSSAAGAKNSVIALGQRVDLPQGTYLAALCLVACSYGATGGTATVHYADGSTSQSELSGPDWYSGSGPLGATYRYRPDGSVDQHPVSIGTGSVWMDPTRTAVAITLPTTADPAPNVSSLHVFALTLQPAATGRSLALRGGHSTTSMLQDSGPQSVEVTVLNAGTVWLERRDGIKVLVDAEGARTVVPAEVGPLAPGEQERLRIGIEHSRDVADGTGVAGSILARAHSSVVAREPAPLTLGVPAYQPTDASLSTHQAPYWFDDAKFGIFIHWGVYSVPGWAPVGKEYAEWYWQHLDDPNDPTYAYHAQKYGKDFVYDDFIPMFTADKWDPRSWVELFDEAGAEYYVLTSKHHEGFALWDSKVSGRNAVAMGPKRDIIAELFAASRTHTPHLRNGLYFSLPEWYNPDNPWMGHPPRNPYTLQPVPYTGYRAGRDFVADYQVPQLMELIDGYDPDVIWYDIGGVNDNLHVVADYLNHAMNRRRPKDVTYNNRAGIAEYDFTTPEYTTYGNTVVAKWEASRGLDPFSYGINRATPDDMYMTAEEVVQTLVDIVSKNGNFLLDIGPNFDGTIPQVMQDRLRETGTWLRTNGESIYGTTYWSRMAQLGNLRFTVKQNEAFYITSLERPGDKLTVGTSVPIRPGDRVTMLGYPRPLDWTVSNGSLVIDVPRGAQRTGDYAWVFRIDWH
jgi:alpha-L-fucosidase